MKQLFVVVILIGSLCAWAQETPSQPAAPGQSLQREQRRGGMGFRRGVGGTIQSINGNTITLTTRDGGSATVTVTPETRFMREGQPAKLSDFKAGDRVMVGGESTGNNAWKAQFVGTFRRGGPGEAGGADRAQMMQRMREGLGKEFLVGEVKSIDGTKLTIHAPDDKDYSAEVDENTIFRRGRESITFPDVKVGDRVMGRGKVNGNNEFVFTNLNVGGGFMFRGERNPREGQPPAPPKQ